MKHFALAALALAAAPAAAQTAAAAPAGPDYANQADWVCLPGRADACGRPLPTADLNPNGFGPVTQATPAADPPIDCFYIYPTVSRDPGMNSDLTPGAGEEMGVAAVQFARFGSLCRTYAPLYRSATLSVIPRAIAGEDVSSAFNLAYGDVLAAFRYYMTHYNQGRPFVLISHSQGTIHATRLIATEIENGPAAAHFLSGILLGFNIEVPEGRLVGGTFQRTPLCSHAGETGCVITYQSYRAGMTPPADALMGRATHDGMTAGCVNPAALGGGSAPLDSYWFASPEGQRGGVVITWSTTGPPPAPFLHTQGLVSGECRHAGKAGWLAITVNADPHDARTDQIPGDVYFGGQIIPGWGLHIGDMGFTQGDLLHALAAQRDAWLQSHH
jgi:hypothetical protein